MKEPKGSIKEMHQVLLNFLRKEHPGTNFILRRSNHNGDLDKGLWFYGNPGTIALSFWNGFDFKINIPNISFIIDEDGHTSLMLSAVGSTEKNFLYGEELRAHIKGLKPSGVYSGQWVKPYGEFMDNYQVSLSEFLMTDKVTIDEWLEEMLKTNNVSYYPAITGTNGFGFISDMEFQFNLERIQRHQSDQATSGFYGIKGGRFKNVYAIEDLKLPEIPFDTRWIFITGMNGSGKSSLLKCITAALLHNYDGGTNPISLEFGMSVQLSMYEGNEENVKKLDIKKNVGNRPLGIPSLGLAAYGSHRVMTHKTAEAYKKSSLHYNLFHDDGRLLNVEKQFELWTEEAETGALTEEASIRRDRLIQIFELTARLIPGIVNMKLPSYLGTGEYTDLFFYLEGNKKPVTFSELASGHKSLYAMFSDMLSRLYGLQERVSDPSELRGIVIIDEIDVHLHPELQKELVIRLSDNFPNIQFIVSTHSAIPLVGAPKESVFLKVSRTADEGTQVEQIDIDIEKLTPNLLLSSPLFGFKGLFSEQAKDDSSRVDTDDNWEISEEKKAALESLVKKHKERKNKRQ